MDGAFGAGTAVHFSPKDLGLNIGFLGLFSDNQRLDFPTVFGQSGTKFFGLISDNHYHIPLLSLKYNEDAT